MKKILSVFLAVIMLFSSISCLFTINVFAYELGKEVDMDMGGADDLPTYEKTVAVEANANNVKGGYIVEENGGYRAVCYETATFLGWYDKSGLLVNKNATLTASDAGGYYGARFDTKNLILDAGFENYAAGSKIYDTGITEKQDWTTHSGKKVEALTAFGSTYADVGYKFSGSQSMKANPPWQLITTDVKLQPNTEYYISVNFAYTTQHPATYMGIEFGLYAPDLAGVNMAAIGGGATYSVSNISVQGTWYNAGLLYTTGDTVPDNATFGYIYQVYNDDESVTTSVENKTDLYIDDVVVAPAEKYSITLDATNVATIVPQNSSDYGYAIKGKSYDFKVYSEPGTEPTVSAGGNVLTPDENGVYSFVPVDDTTIKLDCGAADEGKPAAGKDYKGRDLTKYNKDVYLENVWEGDTVYQETALFVTGKETIKLLYPVDEVISLRSYGLETAYIKGVDFDITEDGLIKILEGSRIPVYAGELTTTTKPDVNAFPLRDDSTTWLKSIGDITYAQYAISVTYKHSKTFEDGYQPKAPVVQNKALNGVISKLEKGETVNIVIFGDSISCGWSSSGINSSIEIFSDKNSADDLMSYNLNVAPYAPTFAQMIEAQLKELYPAADINFKNISLGGRSSPWAAQNTAARLALWKDENGKQVVPDLIMVGFGVNDSAGKVTAANFKANMKAIVDNARIASGNAEMEALYYSPMLPNQLTAAWDVNGMLDYEKALIELAEADENIGVYKLTSIFAEIIKSKAPEDYLSSYWNHGNDFTARMYATGILASIVGDAPVADAPTLERKSATSVTLNKVDGYEYSLDGASWQTSNVFTGLKAETEYTFYQRFAETANTYAGDASAALTITTEVAGAITFTPGNVDGDANNTVDLNDVVALAQIVAGWEGVTHDEAALDIDGNGEVNLNDVVRLAQFVAGWEGTEPSDKPYTKGGKEIEVDAGQIK